MAKRWQIRPRTTVKLIDQILTDRQISDHTSWLKPDYSQLHHPRQLKNSDRFIGRILEAIKRQEKVAIFGDYDHDGTPAAALLAKGLGQCGLNIVDVYIPTREEGYSITDSIVDRFVEQGISLIILVDCGITNRAELERAASLGLEAIVIDHHLVIKDKLPTGAIILNPKQPGDNYPFKELCGCALAFKAVQLVGEATGRLNPNQLKWYLDLVAISTIGDMVPLMGENRLLTHFGLIVLRQTKRPGLAALMQVGAIDPAKLDSYTVAFAICPRLNAPGRMERASLAYDLLITDDPASAATLAAKLNQLNLDRQAELDKVLAEAIESVERQKLQSKKLILVLGDGWADGVVGLVAGRLMERYHRPTVVLSGRKDGLAKGSARSFGDFHLVEALENCQRHLLKYGGHAKAAGLTLAKDQVDLLYDGLINIAEERLTDEALEPRLTIDAALTPAEIKADTVHQLSSLEPYGFGNPRPILAILDVVIIEQRLIGESGRHLKMKVRLSDGASLEVIAFGFGARQAEAKIGESVDIAGMLEVDNWQGRERLQFRLIDWRPATNEILPA